MEASLLKSKGESALWCKRYNDAINYLTEAIELVQTDHELFAFRADAYINIKNYQLALQDANEIIQLKPNLCIGYLRKGTALTQLNQLNEAIATYTTGIQNSSENNFVLRAKLKEITGSNPLLSDLFKVVEESTSEAAMTKTEEEGMTDESKNLLRAKEEKEFGNTAYKQKEFTKALEHYETAMKYNPIDIIIYNNIAAVYFEQKSYEKCIETCNKGIEIGRENRADFKLIAKSFTRIGNAYKKLGDYKSAKVAYEKSMSEQRTPEIKSLISDIEKIIRDQEAQAYIDPVQGELEKETGNSLFKRGDYATAIKHYTEAIKRNPSDPKYYSNRAACYTKLAAFELGLKDCDKCLELDVSFIKGWIRKGNILQGMHQYSNAVDAFQQALMLDPANLEAKAGLRTCSMQCINNPDEAKARTMNDPEIQKILRDPAMMMILEQIQNDPQALLVHLKDPDVGAKLRKLMGSGFITLR